MPSVRRTAEAITEVYTTNVLGPFLTTQAFLPLLQKGRKKQVQHCPCCFPSPLRPPANGMLYSQSPYTSCK